MSETAKRLLRRVEQIDTAAGDNRARAESYQRMTEELVAVTGTASSPDGVVTVVAGPDGAVKEITFSDRVREAQPSALSATVLHTIAQARVIAARAQADVVRRGLGDTDLLDKVLAEESQLFGDRPPADPGPAPVSALPSGGEHAARPARRPGPADDEGFGDFRIMRR
ncbi:YbaB/EbfC family nucleoid-associated protein [Saccharomonospora piscinae]|uniref:YbaB/EbfC DNA-binding family protein n=1 Tax=Saccharomonospora piscinae TaxID=687388 RepID=A0A1V9ACV4_SACPI|nr:YbaB/EbfC family nucleoid-associated protein [Saccharomonospora piscinae]OQO94868.1 hypothetical protein B1813_01995 [Saccharomonospora piscinae]TLW94414.1 YbaB/EbfC family nucleoid-associated protein [Saccharomonospora piscinae]